jgi:hypothetical protein
MLIQSVRRSSSSRVSQPNGKRCPIAGKKEQGQGMFVKGEPLSVGSKALIHLQGRHSLRDVPADGKWQIKEVIHLLFVFEIDLDDVHGKSRARTYLALQIITLIWPAPPSGCEDRVYLYRS